MAKGSEYPEIIIAFATWIKLLTSNAQLRGTRNEFILVINLMGFHYLIVILSGKLEYTYRNYS